MKYMAQVELLTYNLLESTSHKLMIALFPPPKNVHSKTGTFPCSHKPAINVEPHHVTCGRGLDAIGGDGKEAVCESRDHVAGARHGWESCDHVTGARQGLICLVNGEHDHIHLRPAC